MITWYADKIPTHEYDGPVWNRFLEQHIDSEDYQHFTTHPQIDSCVFKFAKQTHQIKTFDNYAAGEQNVVVIGLHGGWTPKKLKYIKQWFTSDPNRLKAWDDEQCKIIIDYSEEGFTTEVFVDIWGWIEQNNLVDRVLYVSSSCNVNELYQEWCQQEHILRNMETVWYGFFATWLLRDRIMCLNFNQLPQASYTGNKRYMCLNRRPHPHRILLLTLLERFKLIEHGAVSMPKHFVELDIQWEKEAWDIPYQWQCLKDRFLGHIDALENNFQSMYNKLPIIADTDDFAFNYALNINEDYYKEFPINVISETLFFSAATFASEKIWKPILLGQIFIVMAAPLYLRSLRKLGFKTFAPYVDEEYDLMMDPVERALGVARTIKKIIALSEEEFLQLLEDCKPAIEHNRRLLQDQDQMEKLVSNALIRTIEKLWIEK